MCSTVLAVRSFNRTGKRGILAQVFAVVAILGNGYASWSIPLDHSLNP
jgi:hypothetical protein